MLNSASPRIGKSRRGRTLRLLAGERAEKKGQQTRTAVFRSSRVLDTPLKQAQDMRLVCGLSMSVLQMRAESGTENVGLEPRGCRQPSALERPVQYPHWKHSPRRAHADALLLC